MKKCWNYILLAMLIYVILLLRKYTNLKTFNIQAVSLSHWNSFKTHSDGKTKEKTFVNSDLETLLVTAIEKLLMFSTLIVCYTKIFGTKITEKNWHSYRMSIDINWHIYRKLIINDLVTFYINKLIYLLYNIIDLLHHIKYFSFYFIIFCDLIHLPLWKVTLKYQLM